jgi:hypothetical protein
VLRDIVHLMCGEGNMNITPAKMRFENSMGRFHNFAPVTTTELVGRELKRVTRMARPPWKITKDEQRFCDEMLPQLVKLPQGMKMPKFFTDTLTFADAALFFCGVGNIILKVCKSICSGQREAFECLIAAMASLYSTTCPKALEPLQYQMVVSVTRAEIHFPIVFSTIVKHCLNEIFLPARGRVARFGAPRFLRLEKIEQYVAVAV